MIGFGYMLALYGAGIKADDSSLPLSGSALSTLGFESPGNNFWVIVLSAFEALTVVTIVALADRLSADHLFLLPAARAGGQQPGRADRRSAGRYQGRRRLREHLSPGTTWGAVANLASSGLQTSPLRIDAIRRALLCARPAGIAPGSVPPGAMLDAAALVDSSLDLSTDPAADRLVRFGLGALLRSSSPLRLQCPRKPKWPETTINITQDEFDEAYDHFQQAGLPMKPDKEAAWRTFAQHRVQYECQLMTLVRLKKPPRGARWTTDRDEAQEPLAIPLVGTASVGGNASEC
jgi:hypothetical protein